MPHIVTKIRVTIHMMHYPLLTLDSARVVRLVDLAAKSDIPVGFSGIEKYVF